MSLAGYADIFCATHFIGVCRRFRIMAVRGGAVYSPAITDFILMVDQTSYMFITGPTDQLVTHEEVTKDQLGGAHTHNETSGVAHFMCRDDADVCRWSRVVEFYSVEQSGRPSAQVLYRPDRSSGREARHADPDQSNMPYDMKDVIHTVVDDGYFFEIHEHYAKNIVVDLLALTETGRIVANQPAMLAGTLDINASVKARALCVSATASIFRW